MSLKAKIEVDGKVFEYPVMEGTEKEKAIDIAKLRADTGCITIDHGFMNTGSCASGITFLDGELGILRYRGYPIEQLAEKSSFIEVSYLLVYGELPTAAQLKSFSQKIADNSKLPEGAGKIIDAFPKDIQWPWPLQLQLHFQHFTIIIRLQIQLQLSVKKLLL